MATVSVRITDEKGGCFNFVKYEEFVMPPRWLGLGYMNALQYVKKMDYHEGDVFVLSYPKTGTHWINNLIHYIRSTAPVYDTPSITPLIVDNPKFEDLIINARKPRLLATHLRPDRLPRNYLARGGKCVFVLRNPKDTAVSLYQMMRDYPGFGSQISWECVLTCFQNGFVPGGSYFDYLDDWQDSIQDNPDQICVVYFEDMKKDCMNELKRIQEFLGCNNDDERLQQIVIRCSLSTLKADVDNGKVKTHFVDKEGKSILYRKGKIGDWRNHFTVAQNEIFDKWIAKGMKKSMFTFQYE